MHCTVIRPLVDTFKMYLCADTATLCQMYLCTDTIQYQYFSKVSDTDTFFITFYVAIFQKISNLTNVD